jgi:hypothetical protein
MPLDFVCNLTLQDCASLNPGLIPAFLDKSCAQDIRLEGNIGRCGWSGAPCVVNGSSSNCAAGDYGSDVRSDPCLTIGLHPKVTPKSVEAVSARGGSSSCNGLAAG